MLEERWTLHETCIMNMMQHNHKAVKQPSSDLEQGRTLSGSLVTHCTQKGSVPGMVDKYADVSHSADLQMRHQKLFTLARHFSVGHFA